MILHGVQVDNYRPSGPVEFIDLARSNVRFMAAQGFNAARVSFAYAGYEPQLGHFDEDYLRSYLAFDRELARARVYDLLDMMQGQYSEAVARMGLPRLDDVHRRQAEQPPSVRAGLHRQPRRAGGVGQLLEEHARGGRRRPPGSLRPRPGPDRPRVRPGPGAARGRGAERAVAGFAVADLLRRLGLPGGRVRPDGIHGFYRRVIPALRAADPRHVIAYEPNLLYDFGKPDRLGDLGDPNLLFAFHDYCLAYAPGQPTNPALESTCPDAENAVLDNADGARSGGRRRAPDGRVGEQPELHRRGADRGAGRPPPRGLDRLGV